jgi:hypothetical protein
MNRTRIRLHKVSSILGFEVLTGVIVRITAVFSDVTPRDLADGYQCFRGNCILYPED